MVGGFSMVGSSIMDSHSSPPCLCLDSMYSSNLRKHLQYRPWSVELSSSFVDSRHGWLQMTAARRRRKQNKDSFFKIVSELGGQYDDTFEDVKTQLLNYFTYKAVRTVLTQLYEMNPTQYRWFYDFVASNKPGDGKRFIRRLVKEKQDLAERVMVTRLHLYGKWVKKCDHAQMYQMISDENLELMRERLLETVIWPSDDTNTEKIG
ncbi:chaperonin-like RbcX protein 2, chloroplastic [Impatiens glandulifera]|uniref:chaperonin-like RbcX protein 2, chloroplastic n=1 Tax=Impatiens glandulifera TaxID=253017 RepID=UPI001FB18DDE|nr:chaperonin-like RbcX protein 2, chloroplastic [Impatiens glandulifera]